MLKAVSKNYKQIITKNIRRHKNTTIEKLRRVKSTDPKEYWRLINNDKKRTDCTVPIDDFFKHFRNINNPTPNSENGPVFIDETINENHEINTPISENEIRKALRDLKRNKGGF